MEIISEKTIKRPPLLTVLCIFTFIWSGLWTLVSLTGIFSSAFISDYLYEFYPELGTFAVNMVIIVCTVGLLLFGLSLWGAILMFHLRRPGFVLYTVSSGMMLIFQLFTVMSNLTPVNAMYLIVSIIFIILYSLFVKKMR